MKKTLFAALTFFALIWGVYTAYWFIFAARIETGVLEWIDEQRHGGSEISYQALSIKGYPYRFTLEVKETNITYPKYDTSWSADVLRISALPYNFDHYIIHAPGQHSLRLAGGQETIFNLARPKLGLRFKDGDIQAIGLSIDELDQISSSASLLHLAELNLDAFNDKSAGRLRATIQLRNAKLNKLQNIPSSLTEEAVGPLRIALELNNSNMLLDDPSQWMKSKGLLKIPHLEFKWGELSGSLSGGIEQDTSGYLEGTLNLVLDDKKQARDFLKHHIRPMLNDEAQNVLDTVLHGPLAGDGQSHIPLNFKDGKVYYAFIALGEAPRL